MNRKLLGIFVALAPVMQAGAQQGDPAAGKAKADSTAAAPNAPRRPRCPATAPRAIDPAPMPVSKAARMLPKAAPRRAGSTCLKM